MNENIITDKLNNIIERELLTEHPNGVEDLEELLALAKDLYEAEVSKIEEKTSPNNKAILSDDLIRLRKNIELLEKQIEDERPKVLRPDNEARAERNKAWVKSIGASIDELRQGLNDKRQARRDEYTSSLPPVDSPSSKLR